MTPPALISFSLESAICAELGLFSIYLLSGPRRGGPALYLLAALALCVAGLIAGNLLIAAAGLQNLGDCLLFLDLLLPPLLYLYVLQIRQNARPLTTADALHVLPAVAGLTVWKLQAVDSMDLYVNIFWLAYLAAAAFTVFLHFAAYAPRARQKFLVQTFALLVSAWLLRLVIIAQAPHEPAFREGLPFLLVLTAIFAATCVMLLTALRHPDLLSKPGSHVKYALSADDEETLDRLALRLTKLVETEQPFLDPDFSLEALARILDTSPRKVSQLVNARHGMNVAAWLNSLRTNAAAQLLANVSKPVKIVMFESGFRSKSIFNREFQRNFGVSPTQFRQDTVRKSSQSQT